MSGQERVCNNFFIDGVEEMTMNEGCFVIFIPCRTLVT